MSAFFIQVESKIVCLFLEGQNGLSVGVMSIFEVIFLHELFILKVTVSGLDAMELVSQSQEVLISLLDFKDFSLKLRNEQILLVAGKVNAIVVL